MDATLRRVPQGILFVEAYRRASGVSMVANARLETASQGLFLITGLLRTDSEAAESGSVVRNAPRHEIEKEHVSIPSWPRTEPIDSQKYRIPPSALHVIAAQDGVGSVVLISPVKDGDLVRDW